MEFVDLGLKTFRAEMAANGETLHPATACAGLLLCVLYVSHSTGECIRVNIFLEHLSLKDSYQTHLTNLIPIVPSGLSLQPIYQDAGRRIPPEDFDNVPNPQPRTRPRYQTRA